MVTFSGDKLLGGPQSGMLVGAKEHVFACSRHPLYRALRLDKMVLAALEATLQIYREGREQHLPVWDALERSPEDCRVIAQKMADSIEGAIVEEDLSYTGGGALPNQSLPTYCVVLTDDSLVELAEKLRRGRQPILVRVQKGSMRIDPRTLLDDEWMIVVERINTLRNEQSQDK